MKNIRNKFCRGFTLVELVAILGCLSLIMGVASVLLFQMFDLQTQTKEFSELARSTNRLTTVFRNDVKHFGKPEIVVIPDNAANTAQPNTLLRWQSADSSTGATPSVEVEYELRSGQFPGQQLVRRLEKSGDAKPIVEDYRLPDDSVIEFFVGEGKHEGLVALSLWKKMSDVAVPRKEDMNPFTRSVTSSNSDSEQNESPRAGFWRTILAHYDNVSDTEGEKP